MDQPRPRLPCPPPGGPRHRPAPPTNRSGPLSQNRVPAYVLTMGTPANPMLLLQPWPDAPSTLDDVSGGVTVGPYANAALALVLTGEDRSVPVGGTRPGAGRERETQARSRRALIPLSTARAHLMQIAVICHPRAPGLRARTHALIVASTLVFFGFGACGGSSAPVEETSAGRRGGHTRLELCNAAASSGGRPRIATFRQPKKITLQADAAVHYSPNANPRLYHRSNARNPITSTATAAGMAYHLLYCRLVICSPLLPKPSIHGSIYALCYQKHSIYLHLHLLQRPPKPPHHLHFLFFSLSRGSLAHTTSIRFHLGTMSSFSPSFRHRDPSCVRSWVFGVFGFVLSAITRVSPTPHFCSSNPCRPLAPRPHTSHLTPHTSHLTPHTSHLTPHTSHLTPHASHLTPHTRPCPLPLNLDNDDCYLEVQSLSATTSSLV
ncbi:hypothetical protein EVG20_g10800 [Dentipellis fragilis]|uniref:Uncharacterized protein n=1 Tax=Dentipellis fragilis TaxID=205917 RepID=A0A4Y9XNH8_9AGAM|nr:hypothetical protein EVG20_g10800 [Dentipellis fragilis]